MFSFKLKYFKEKNYQSSLSWIDWRFISAFKLKINELNKYNQMAQILFETKCIDQISDYEITRGFFL